MSESFLRYKVNIPHLTALGTRLLLSAKGSNQTYKPAHHIEVQGMSKSAQIFRVFISSPFNDMKKERDALQNYVFPRLRKLCQQYGARFQPIDLRWGISEEAALDQQTIRICLSEIERCQRLTPKPNFMILLGDRYGWRPIPDEIPAMEFHEITRRLDQKERRQAVLLLKKWYNQIDENAIPPVYRLRPRKGKLKNYESWRLIEQKLSKSLEDAIVDMQLSDEQRMKYASSATEQEIIKGMLRVSDAKEHVYCFLRKIEGLPQDLSAKDFTDIDDNTGRLASCAQSKLNDLKKSIRNWLPDTVYDYVANWAGNDVTTNHIDQLCHDVYSCLSQSIQKRLDLFKAADLLEEEVRSHNYFGNERTKFFVGRRKMLNDISQNVAIKNTSTTGKVEPFVIYGKSGSGKSSLIAKAIEQSRRECPEAYIMSRFIGVTSSSSNIHTLLDGMCREISRFYGRDEVSIPSSYKELIDDFKTRLEYPTADHPLLIFLDALDQLSDTNNARNLDWLPDELPAYVRLVITTLPGECLSNLKKMLSSDSNILELEAMPKEEGDALLDLWLKDASRTLQKEQKDEILRKFDGNGLPLYLRLAFEEAKNWKSYTKNNRLNSNIRGIIRNMFKRLSNNANHGKTLVSYSLGYLKAAKNGLTEDEILDILSADRDVMDDFKRRSPKSPPTNVLPVAVWSRLFIDLEPYITWRNADGTSLLSFFHRQFGEVVSADYLKDPIKVKHHSALANYFGNQANAVEHNGKQVLNLRKLSELPYQQLNGSLWLELESTLCDLSFIEAKCSSNMMYDLIIDYNSSVGSILIPSERREKIMSFARFVRTNSHILLKYPSLTFQQALNEPDSMLPAQVAFKRLKKDSDSHLLIKKNKPQTPSACISTLIGHTNEVWSCDVSNDGRNIVSASADGTIKIWNASNGSDISTFKGHRKLVEVCSYSPKPNDRRILSADRDGNMMIWDSVTGDQVVSSFFGDKDTEADCNFSSDGKFVVSASRDKTLSVYDSYSGNLLYKLDGYDYPIKACAFSPDGKRLVSGDINNQIKLWDVKTRTVLCTRDNAHKSDVWRCRFSPDGKWIASVSTDGTLKKWDGWTLKEIKANVPSALLQEQKEESYCICQVCGHTQSYKCLEKECVCCYVPTEHPIWTLDISPNGKLIASGSFDNTLKIWDVDESIELGVLYGHEGQIWGCAFFPNCKQVVSASWDSTLKIWDLSSVVTNQQVSVGDDTKHTIRNHDSGFMQRHSSDLEIPSSNHSVSRCAPAKPIDLTGPILCTAISPDSRLIVSASWDGWLRRWQLDTGIELSPMRVHKGYITALTFLPPNGKLLLLCDDRGQLKLFDTDTWSETSRLRAHLGQITACSFSQDGKYVLSSSRDRTLKHWELDSDGLGLHHCKILVKEEDDESVESCTFSYNNEWIAAGTSSGKIRLWNVYTEKEEPSFQAHTSSVLWCTFSPKDNSLLSSSMDGTLKMWDLTSREELKSFTEHTGAVQTGYFSPNGMNIVSASWDRKLKVWDTLTGEVISTLYGHTGEVQDGRFSPDGKMIVSASMDGTVRLWDTSTGTQIALIVGPTDWVKGCSFSSNGHKALSYSHHGAVKMSGHTGEEILTLSDHNGEILSSTFSPDGTKLLSASSDKTLKVWDTVTGKLLATLDGHNGRVQSCAISPDGTKIVSGSWDKTLKIWDISTYNNLATLNDHTGWIQQVTFSPDGTHILSTSMDQTAKIWDTNKESLEATFTHDNFIGHCSFSPNSDRIVCACHNKLWLWDLRNNGDNNLSLLTGHEEKVICCAFSPDGTKIVSGSFDNILKIWDAHTGEQLATLTGHEGSVLTCAFSPNSDRVISGSNDSLLKVWDVVHKRELCKYWAGRPIHSVSYNPSGELIAAGDSAGIIHILQEISAS